ncbi:lipopolysaccharide biosynthesis protein [Desulfatitalea tepidiphila]|uniref:lipopolysaccharide biosynthesis protein n=1 Tax=Desulfatitalea tepidiphila TaxID=1185843 RepID=UPI0013793031|nr:lipopolysaccharide biosynthesis protein [Desulfatitalea tepidiphila]
MIDTTEVKAFKGATWLALFKMISQIVSWISTIFVARMLVPADYGLMEMATFITGYAMMFSELGLGAAIIQRPHPTNSELSSVFWSSIAISLFFACCCFFLAYPTAWIFKESRVISITQTVSIVFILTGIQIVPLNLLRKQFKFKASGFIDATGIIVSCIFMIATAYIGWGVWTLIGGTIVKNFTCLILVIILQDWRPSFKFVYKEAIEYFNFGYQIALGNSIGYINKKSDSFFAGRLWNPGTLGIYSFAKQLSRIPNDKIVSLINQVAFPAFAKLNTDKNRFNTFYLDIVKTITCLVLPLFIGGFLIGDELVRLLLDKKWYPMIFIFKMMCLTEIVTPLSAVNSMVHGAQGRPKFYLGFNIVMLIFMPASFFLAAPYGLNAMVYPWFTSYLLLCIGWNHFTLRQIGLSYKDYILNLKTPLMGVILMSLVVLLSGSLLNFLKMSSQYENAVHLIIKVVLGGSVYIFYILSFDKPMLQKIKIIIKK